jgi:hypothetical protein
MIQYFFSKDKAQVTKRRDSKMNFLHIKLWFGSCLSFIIFCIFLLILSACGGGADRSDDSSSDTGSITFSPVWPSSTNLSQINQVNPPPICALYKIDTVSGYIYNSSDIEVASKSVLCSIGKMTISSIPYESGLKLVIKGIVSGVAAWEGSYGRFTLSPGGHDAGKIPMNPTRGPYTIKVKAGSGGSISPSVDEVVYYGTDKTFTITPDPNCDVADVLVDDKSKGPVTQYTFKSVEDNHRITAKFAIHKYNVNVTSSPGGSTIPAGLQHINHGDSITITAKANNGYHFTTWSGDNISTDNPLTITNVTSDMNIQANFGRNLWISTSMTNAPKARYSHTAVWTRREMIVWGGYTGLSALDTGSAYDPASDSWSEIDKTGAPMPRWNHTAVWTGREMIVWGGQDGSSALNTGGVYDYASDSWSKINKTGAPTPRWNHTAVWTGREMIVWGGWDGSSFFNNGGAYDPVSDSWSTISITSETPTPRQHHTAVWATLGMNEGMIVWGGLFRNDGGVYDPATRRWITTPTTEAPSPRSHHTAVLRDTEMIVWGGYYREPLTRIESYLNTGSILSTSGWRPITTTDAPIGRYGHTAVWADTEMIVWGGYNDPDYLNTGGVYDPRSNDWSPPIPTTDAPIPRMFHTAVWTGTEMIVWGGQDGSKEALNTGGVYTP